MFRMNLRIISSGYYNRLPRSSFSREVENNSNSYINAPLVIETPITQE